MNIPLDARTPSFDDSGDAAIKNVATVWDWDFWVKYIDQMAINRYNVLSLWNPHPFPSMITLDEFPDVALSDVYTTNYKPTGYVNEMGDPQLVSSIVFDHLQLVKKITINEKISFWQKVMQYAKDRGIDIYWITWNICPNSVATPVEPFYKSYGINMRKEKPGKHGITHQMDNPITIAYHRAAVKQFLLTYPQVKGIGVTAGEHMPLKWEGKNREEWLWETYGLGILDAKKEQANREIPFIHRVWHSDMEEIMKYWGNYPDRFDVSFKYVKARLYSSPKPTFHHEHIQNMEQYGLKSWWNLRNDDIFVYRWANVEYVRSLIANLPQSNTQGFYMGSDGYVWAKEFISKTPQLSGEYEFDKHHMRFMLWGRLAYNNQLSEAFFEQKFTDYYNVDKNVFTAWQKASEIIPMVNRFHWRNWDADWSVEACTARPKKGGFRDVFDFVSNPVMESQNLINCEDYAKAKLAGRQIIEKTPEAVSDELIDLAKETLGFVEKYNAAKDAHQVNAILSDMQAMANLGLYYAYKIKAATHLAFYEQTSDKSHLKLSISHMQKAALYANAYAEISNSNYKPQMLARPGLLDWDTMLKEVGNELMLLKKYGDQGISST
jgi:hypothetical protein